MKEAKRQHYSWPILYGPVSVKSRVDRRGCSGTYLLARIGCLHSMFDVHVGGGVQLAYGEGGPVQLTGRTNKVYSVLHRMLFIWKSIESWVCCIEKHFGSYK